MEIKDYRIKKKFDGVELIVRPGNRYGNSPAGDRVRVDESELNNSSTMSACMTDAEAEELERKREAARLESEKRRGVEKRSGVRGMVDAALARISEGAEDPNVRLARQRAQAETLESDRLAAARAASAEADHLFNTESSESLPDPKPQKKGRKG